MGSLFNLLYILLVSAGIFYAQAGSSYAQTEMEMGSEPVYIEAETFDYDENAKIVNAIGKVQVTQGERVVLSDELTYYLSENIVLASGSVRVLEKDGNVYFAEKIEFKDDLKEGVVRDFRARLSDGSLLASNTATRISEDVTKLAQAVYSPCKLCKEDPEKAPLWQFKAQEVTHDTAQEKMYYRDARLEVYGVPVAYTPYFSHPTPDAKRKSGFLTPTYRGSGSLGAAVETPYYYTFSDSMDATITPIFTTSEGVILFNEFRHLTESGYYQIRGSITYPDKRDDLGDRIADKKELRGHIDGFGYFNINEDWDWGFAVRRATDDTYLGRYGFAHEDTLTSTAYIEKTSGREYVMLRGLAFQGLRVDDDPDVTPFVLPVAAYSYESNQGYMGGRWFVDANMMALTRKLGADSNRATSTVGWRLPVKSIGGHFYELKTSVRGDVYSVNDYMFTNEAGAFDETDDPFTRLTPEIEMSWRYPLINRFATSSSGSYLTLEPRVSVLASPNEDDPQEVPNEDSQIVEFSDVNLFAANRYPGYDVIETGFRVNYGLGGTLYIDEKTFFDYLFGQNYHADDDSTFSALIGDMDDSMSDYVGRLAAKIGFINTSYRFRLMNDNFAARRNEVDTLFDFNPVTFSVDYDSFHDDFYLGDRKQIGLGTSWAINENWSVHASGQRDLSENGGLIYMGSGVTFQNECLAVISGINREFTRDRDIEPSTSFIVRVALKNLD